MTPIVKLIYFLYFGVPLFWSSSRVVVLSLTYLNHRVRWPPNESETEDDNLIWPYFNTSRAASELHTDNN